MKESVIYQDILQKGQKQGQEQLIIRQLTRRFGELEPSVIEQVQLLSLEQLEALGEVLLDFTEITDLQSWLTQQ